jgi:16S rRNA (uracil1498-N3)-methyltransferase
MKSPPWLLAEPGQLDAGTTVALGPAESNHVAGALRCRAGDRVVLIDGAGTVADAFLVEVGSTKVIAEVEDLRVDDRPGGDGLTLALAVVERQAMDWAVQKAVEVGVRQFVPLLTERTQGGRGDSSNRIEHWRRVALQALKQCRRSWGMEVGEPRRLWQLVSEAGTPGGIVADSEGGSMSTVPAGVGTLIVGPEGGLTSSELGILDNAGWTRLKLGGNILRAETAAIVGAALLVARNEGML